MQSKSIDQNFGLTIEDMKSGRPQKSRRSDFAVRLRTLREATGLSQSEIARRLGIRQPSYALWETYNVALKPEQLVALADTLGVTVEQFFGDTTKASRRAGPAGRARQLFEAVSKLPRAQQQHVLTVVEAFVEKKAAG